jgi:phycocyanobilin:ferredoxin oxidoreductase
MQGLLRHQQHDLIRRLADAIEAIWQHHLQLSPYSVPEDLGYIQGSLEGERLTIENRCYQTPQFRKLHLELAQVGVGLDILHCVMFPNPNYDLPIFGTDIVGARGQISAAIVDLSPVNANRVLPARYQEGLLDLPASNFAQPRALPTWATIFSDFCLFVRPDSGAEEDLFLERVKGFLTLHCQIASSTAPLTSDAEIANVVSGHKNYCTQQRQNDKTRRVLEKSFGAEWADRYMNTMLFDYVSS